MFQKKAEFIIDNKYSKVYKSEYDMLQIVEMLQTSQYAVKTLILEDDAHIGLQMYGGDCTFDEFYEAYKSFGASIEKVSAYMRDIPLSMTIYDDGTVSMLSAMNIELTDVISVKKKTL